MLCRHGKYTVSNDHSGHGFYGQNTFTTFLGSLRVRPRKTAFSISIWQMRYVMLSGLNADLNQCALNQEKQWDAYNMGGPWRVAGGIAEATSSINVGTLTVDSCSPAAKQLVWRRTATKPLEPSKDPQKNQEKLNKAVANLFKDSPPQPRK